MNECITFLASTKESSGLTNRQLNQTNKVSQNVLISLQESWRSHYCEKSSNLSQYAFLEKVSKTAIDSGMCFEDTVSEKLFLFKENVDSKIVDFNLTFFSQFRSILL